MAEATVAMAFSLVVVALLAVVPVPVPCCLSVYMYISSPVLCLSSTLSTGQNTHYYSEKRENAG